MTFTALVLDLSGSEADLLADALLEAGALSVSCEELRAAHEPPNLSEPGEPASWPRVRLTALCADGREPALVLEAAGVPPVVRDEFDERAWPDDVYGLVPRTLGDLGDPDLGPLHLAWGMAKAAVIRARRTRTAR